MLKIPVTKSCHKNWDIPTLNKKIPCFTANPKIVIDFSAIMDKPLKYFSLAKKQTQFLITLLLVTLLSGCSDKFSGKSEKAYNTSKTKIESKLSKEDKVKLEKALRVIISCAMNEKLNNPEKFNGKSFDEISLGIIDGKSFNDVVGFAEGFLKNRVTRKISGLKIEADSLNKQKNKLQEITSNLSALKITNTQIIEDDFFGTKEPFLNYTFINLTGMPLIGEYRFQIDIYTKSTGKLIGSYQEGTTLNDGSTINTNETVTMSKHLSDEVKMNSNFWKNAKYPVKDLSYFDLIINVFPVKYTTTDNKTFEKPEADEGYYLKKINEINSEIKQLLAAPPLTLDDMELTGE
jgi:hypothetical protein